MIKENIIEILLELDKVVDEIFEKNKDCVSEILSEFKEFLENFENIEDKLYVLSHLKHIIGTYFSNALLENYVKFEVEEVKDLC